MAPIRSLTAARAYGQQAVRQGGYSALARRNAESARLSGSVDSFVHSHPIHAGILLADAQAGLERRAAAAAGGMSLNGRTRHYDPLSEADFVISRSQIENSIRCMRCFYLSRRLRVERASGPGHPINSRLDALMKNEFDAYRERGLAHPDVTAAGLGDLVPLKTLLLASEAGPGEWKDGVWRVNFEGLQFYHAGLDLHVQGAVDDIWADMITKTLHVVDVKATSNKEDISIDLEKPGIPDYKVRQIRGYMRQMEIYQWLLRNVLAQDVDALRVQCREEFIRKMGDLAAEFRGKSKASRSTEKLLREARELSEKRARKMAQIGALEALKGFTVSDTGFFYYLNTDRGQANFSDKRLQFVADILPYSGSDAWVEGAIESALESLKSAELPPKNTDCGHCREREQSVRHEFPELSRLRDEAEDDRHS